MLVSDVWTRVYEFTGSSGNQGTAFVIDKPGGNQFLITAEHCTNGEQFELITLRAPWSHGGHCFVENATRIDFPLSRDDDIAVFVLSSPLETVGSLSLAVSGDVTLTQDAFIVGHPFTAQHHGILIPVVRKCIIAGMAQYQRQGRPDNTDLTLVDGAGVGSFLIDVEANRGYSGAPLVIQHHAGDWVVAGVVAGRIREDGEGRQEQRVSMHFSIVTNSEFCLDQIG